jgi:predicted CXXCH cytochrome family protein
MCTRCHKELPLDKKMVHEPLKDKDSPCLTCHNPHKSTASKLLTADNVTALCARCHRDVVKNPMYHQADKVPQSCVGCHEAHASDAKKLLKAPSPDVCYKCHKELKERVANAAELHGPMNAGCQACHDPHQVKAGKGLAKVGPALCIMCHDDLKGTVASMEAHHKKPLEDKGCNRCHDPHAAVMKPMLMATQDVLCLRCHKDDVKTAEGQTLQGIGAVMVEGAKGHGPLANKQCTGCHEPHGNTEFRFLTGAYPATLYSAYKAEGYAFCAKCHEPTLTTARQTTTATKFRNGDLNLHYVHVNNPTKGRTCRMCHSPHASKNQHMLRDTLPFGDWHMPLGYTATETGGSCASGCHTTKSYDRDTPVTYAKPAPGKPVDKVVSPTEAQRGAATTSASAPSAAEKAPAASKPPAK